LRLQGELLLRTEGEDSAAAAEGSFRRALEIARVQDALLWELRAALSFARYWHRAQRRSEARQVLEPVYGRLSEGYATEDARAAKSLLQLL
jgi:predicted ATPase